MKKTYTKPQICFESFVMNTNIAGSCELDTPLPSSTESCGYPIQGAVVFVEGITGCTYKPQNGVYNGFCYHVPIESKNLFNS
ncbi:MAG: hypothetical protein E7469_06475 [Ruminococcaceae bacterium]|nr:hypothetical protein [Oscillospiraceae bacterium]